MHRQTDHFARGLLGDREIAKTIAAIGEYRLLVQTLRIVNRCRNPLGFQRRPEGVAVRHANGVLGIDVRVAGGEGRGGDRKSVV